MFDMEHFFIHYIHHYLLVYGLSGLTGRLANASERPSGHLPCMYHQEKISGHHEALKDRNISSFRRMTKLHRQRLTKDLIRKIVCSCFRLPHPELSVSSNDCNDQAAGIILVRRHDALSSVPSRTKGDAC